MGMLKEFKDFAMKGNIVDLAVAVVIGAAFGKVIDGFLDGILMPLVAMIAGKPDFSGLSTTIGGTVFPYGAFIQALIMFIMVAAVLFLVVKAMNKAMPPKPEAPAGPSSTDALLMEIRDNLKK